MTQKFASDVTADLVTRSGFRFHVRAAGPGDAAALTGLFDHMTKDDLRFRFLSAVRKVSPQQIEAMTNVDHIRTEDFLAFEPGGTRIIANAMLAADKALEIAEVAIAVDSEFKDRGIEATLLEHVARTAKAHGFKRLQSIESRENQAMIEAESGLGFKARGIEGDASIVLLEARLDEAA